MSDERVKTLKKEIDGLRDELEHVFPEHEELYNRLTRRLEGKKRELDELQPVTHWWQRLFR